MNLDQINSLIWKNQEHDLDRATSGRITFWQDNIKLFLDSSIPQQLSGAELATIMFIFSIMTIFPY